MSMEYFPGGKIIAFEGLDNCFKETNARAFAEKLATTFPFGRIEYESFPRYDDWSSALLKKWLNGDFDRDLLKQCPEVIKSFFTIDRVAYWNSKIFSREFGYTTNIELYKSENHPHAFIFDRYNVSNILYNNKRITPEDFRSEESMEIPSPDIVVWLMYHNFDFYISELQKKKNRDMNENDTNMLREVWDKISYIKNGKIFERAGITPVWIYCDERNKQIKSRDKLTFEIWEEVSTVVNSMNGKYERKSKNDK